MRRIYENEFNFYENKYYDSEFGLIEGEYTHGKITSFVEICYTTCMWHNLLHSRILYDKNGELESMQNKYQIPYPDELRDNIISKNLRLLRGNLPSYDIQIKKAFARRDMVSVNHRTAAFLESYFDIIFALNKLATHPGEKRMVQYVKAQAEISGAQRNMWSALQRS